MAGHDITPDALRKRFHYDPATGLFFSRKSGKQTSSKINPEGYLRVSLCGHACLAHRAAWAYVYGKWPDNVIDHINRVKTDNRIENLRDVQRLWNSQNKSSAKNYYLWKGRYRAALFVDGALLKLGSYKTEDEAKAIVLAAKKQFHQGFIA